MTAGRADRFEMIVDAGAAALFAFAAGYSAFAFIATAAAPAGAAMLAFFSMFAGLRLVRPPVPGFVLGDFSIPDLLAEDVDELVLTDADRLHVSGELVLEDALPPPAPDSRVVRLFDPSAMPTPGQRLDRIDRH